MKDHRTEIYKQGWQACIDGEDVNPYVIYSSDYTYWSDGWFECKMNLVRSEPCGIEQAFKRGDEK